MYRLSVVLTLVLAALSVAAADTDREASQVSFDSVVVMRELVPADALDGYRAFHLAVIRSQAEQRARSLIWERHYFGADGQTTYEEALARWMPLALDGDPEALSSLGVMYDLGLGVEPDQARAVRLYRRAAEQGFIPAWNNLGIAYALGRGVARDDTQAVAWLRKAAEQGFALARNTLGVMYLDGGWGLRDDLTGVKWVASATKERLFEAPQHNRELFSAYRRGLRYAEGRGVPRDPVEAYKAFAFAAVKGHSEAAQRMAALTETVEQANMERWARSYFSVPEDELEKQKELVGKIHHGLCYAFSDNNMVRVRKVLKNSSIRFLGKELTLEHAYRHLRCSFLNADNIDLFRVPVENPTEAELTGQSLVYYFVREAEDPFLMGKILMCKRDYGRGCMNVFEHIEMILGYAAESPVQAEILNNYRGLLRSNARTLTYNGAFCRVYLLDEASRACR